MRSEQWFSDEVRWDEHASNIADDILKKWGAHPDLPSDIFLNLVFNPIYERNQDYKALKETESVWKRMQKYPHCFELAAARGQLDTLDMQGLARDASAMMVTKTRFSFSGWKVDSADIQDYIAEGELSESLLQGLFIVLRDRFPKNAYLFPPHLLRTSHLSRTLPQPRSKQKSTPQSLPSVALFPYRTTKSRHWVLYALIKPDDTTTTERLILFKRPNVPSAALDWANKYIANTFAMSIEEQMLPDKSFTDDGGS
jgi:hypothetical protein